MRLRTTARMGIRTSRNSAPLLPVVGPLLDGVAHTALAAFSLRRLRAAYTGPALRVRRSSDNVEADIGFAAVGPNLITNGDLSGGATGWTLGAGVTVTGGALSATNAGQIAWQNCGLIQGRTYWFSFDFNSTAGLNLRVGNTSANGAANVYFRSSVNGRSGTIQGSFVAVNNSGAISLEADSATYSGTISNVVVREVGAGGNDLNLAALANFVTPNNTSQATVPSSFVTTWYDQTGNGNNIANATAANQPLVVSAGALAPQGVTFSGAQDLLGATAVTASALAAVMQYNTDANQYVMGAGGAGNIIIFRLVGGTLRVGAATTASELADFSDSTIGTPVQMYAAGTFREPFLFRNGAPVTRGPLTPLGSFSTVLSLGSRRIGGASPAYFSGAFQEAIFFANGLSDAERTRLSRNQGTAFGIAVP